MNKDYLFIDPTLPAVNSRTTYATFDSTADLFRFVDEQKIQPRQEFWFVVKLVPGENIFRSVFEFLYEG